jgi:hypothetical protein
MGTNDRARGLAILIVLAVSLNGNQAGGQASKPKPRRAPQTPEQKAPMPEPGPPARTERLTMTPAVACASISAYKQYEPLPEAAVTKDEKLLVYYEPLNFATKKVEGKFQGHLVQDVRVRRRGRKEVLWSRDKLFEYKPEGPQPNLLANLTTKLSFKDLTPGEYDLDIILHDMVAGDPPAQQVLRFQIKPSPPPAPPKDDKEKPAKDEEEEEAEAPNPG